ncbi:cytochrome c [Pararobbsia alpina]|uniref:PQQ-dependent sugar dehydrogenase n=1 Tax=Pararobbsia alpina TaxID=621374 RepID=UPI0039A406A9
MSVSPLPSLKTLVRAFACCALVTASFVVTAPPCDAQATAQAAPLTPAGSASRGKVYFSQHCAICHADKIGADGSPINEQGPGLVGVLGRRSGSLSGFSYSDALGKAGLTWDPATLDRFLTNPAAAVPGTTMPASIRSAGDRHDVIAYLATLTPQRAERASETAVPSQAGASSQSPAVPQARASSQAPGASQSASVSQTANSSQPPASSQAPSTSDFHASDWQNASPGVAHRITVSDLPAPYASKSSGNGPQVVKQPASASLAVPPGFSVHLFVSGLTNPRILRVAPNGDIFVAETAENRIRILRAADGAATPSANEIYADGLDRPFGIAFYPPGNHPQWLYVANNNSVVRFPYHPGDLKAQGEAAVVVPHLTDSRGGHSTRDVAFSLDGKRMFISIGSGSNVADGMSRKSPEAIDRWEADHGLGAAWDSEEQRATIVVTDPEGHAPLRNFATGIRNGVGVAVDRTTGELWTSTNERDGLGDDIVPDYITRVSEGAFYGWPWYYLGNHEDPRHANERPDLAGKIRIPDVLLQAHSASLEMCFYTATQGPAAFPAEYRGDIFAAFHGSWNRSTRTGYKVVRVRLNHGVPTGEYDDFLTGFVASDRTVWGRPVGVAVAHDGALLVSEDGNGTMWRVSYSAH